MVNVYVWDILNIKILTLSYSFIDILSLTIIFSNNDPYLVVAIRHNHIVLLHIPLDIIIKSLVLDSSEYLSSVFYLFKVDTISYL